MQLNGIDHWLWLAGLLGNVVLAYVLLVRRRAQSYPAFTGLIALNVARNLALFVVYRHAGAYAYYYAFLAFAAVDYILQIAVVYEIGRHVFRMVADDREMKTSLVLVGVAALIISGALSWIALPAAKWLSDTLVIRTDLLTAALMAELFVAMLALSAKYGLPWKTHAARIAQGFGAYSFLCIVVEALHTYFGVKDGSTAYHAVTRIRIAAYDLTVLYWAVALSQNAPAEREMPRELQIQLIALQKRASTIAGLLQSWRRA